MRRRHIAVVGASLAGVRTVEALRRLEDDSRITMIGAEPDLPYDRPPLSKEILLGKAEADALSLVGSAGLAVLDVDLRLGTRATGLDLTTRTLSLDGPDSSGERLDFDELVIATGAEPRRAAGLPGPEQLRGTHQLRTLADGVALRRAFEDAPRIVVLGGGFIGAEVASSARALGLDVTVVDLAPTLMQRALGDVIGSRLTDIARDAGVRLRLGDTITEVVGADRVEAVRLGDGSLLEADLLVLGLGAVPNTGWLEGSGLDLSDGVRCDATLAAAPGIHAVGDVVRWEHPRYGSLRCEHWTAAGEHADAVAATLTGTPTAADAVPYAWSDQFGHKLQIAGVLRPGDEVRYLVEEDEKFVAVAGGRGVQSAAIALNAPGALVRQRIKLAASPPWDDEMGTR